MEKISSKEAAQRKHRLNVAITLHEIENNPLSAEQISMFEMFEHKGWSFEKRRKHILSRYISTDSDDKMLAAE